jgi:hypothetical protein
LYADLSDSHIGGIQGRILPANPISLPASAPGVTGIFAAQIVAVDAATGSIVGASDQWMELFRIHRAHALVHK